MIVLKDFKTTSQVFNVGDEIFYDIENLEHWVAGEFVGLETFIEKMTIPVPVPVAATEVPTVTYG